MPVPLPVEVARAGIETKRSGLPSAGQAAEATDDAAVVGAHPVASRTVIGAPRSVRGGRRERVRLDRGPRPSLARHLDPTAPAPVEDVSHIARSRRLAVVA